jgi:phosphoadenosine phosphosulfate reductase
MDEQLCMLGFGVSLAEKVEKAILNLQYYEAEALRRDPVNGYYLCDSYGKDSGVILELAKRSGVKFVAHHNLTTLDPPELIHFGRKNHPDTVVHRPKVAMLTRLAIGTDGPPTRMNRWCCEEYKERGGSGMVRTFGVRAAESARRKANWKTWTPHRKDGWLLNPILYWTDNDVWQYTRQERIPYCPLYDDGFTRLGCIGCPQAGKQRFAHFARWPRYERAWKTAMTKYWETTGCTLRRNGEARSWVSHGVESADDLWRWWMEELPEPEENDCQMGLF